ncbi:dual specificity protein kinase splA-like isoform X2 [Limulus polyphemus]|uniref:Dual specificity protein kinase splA-like isoform X2 n=1 Tax=Limulus polyphemus TaxID=6850 RepID=A0ABM1SYM7_LIMPO|nr:dual specificity protein kinase splA-like isoform X2 [Limulus polyphemus]
MENETSDVNSGNRNISLISFSDHQMSLGTNPKLRNLLTQSSEKTDSSSGITSPLSKMFNVSQSSLATGPENGLEMREMPVATGDDNSNGSSRNVILRELLNQDEDGVLELPGKSRFPSGSGKSGMSLDMDSFRSDTNREASKRPVNNNNMLRKLLNSEVESDRNSRKSQDMLIQQLLKAESPEKNENSVGGDANSQSSSSDQIFKDFGLGSSHSSNSLSLPTSLSEALSSLSKRKSDDNTDSGTKPPSKRPAIQHPHLAGQNPMLASMLAQTPKTEPSVPTTIANSIMSQLPQDRLPKNLEKKLIQTPCVVMTSGSSSISTQHGTGHTMSTNHSLLHQDVVTADSRGHVTLSHHPVTTVNPSLGQLPQHGFTTQHQQYQGFLSRILNSSDGSQLTRALAAASTNATISNQSGQSIYNNNFQLSNQVFQQPNKSLTLSDLLGDVSSFDSVVGLTAQSQTSDPMLSQILDEVCVYPRVWSMQQEMETTPIDDNMIRKILDEVFEQPSGSSTSESVPSNNQSVNTVQDVHEKLAINAIQQQLMSYETTARSSTTTAHAAPSSSYIQSSGMGLGTVVPPNIVVNFSSTHNYPSVPSLPTYSSGTQAGHRLKAQNSGVLTGVQQGVAVGNFQRPGGSQLLNSGGGGLTPEVYHRLLERRQKMLQHQKRLRAQQQQQQQVVQSSQTASEPMTPVSASVFPENTNDMLNNTVAPNVTLQRFNGITDQQLSPRYNTTLLGQTGQSQLSPGHQPPYSPLSQQSFPNPSPPVTSGYSQQQHRQPTYLPSSPVTVTGGKPQSPHLQAHSSQTQWNQRTAPNTTTTGSVQQQNPMLNAQLSQSSFSGQGRFITQAQRQIQVRSLSSPNSVTSQINSSFPNQSDGQFQPQSPGHLYQQPSQAPSKQQRIQRVVSIPSHVNSPRTPHGGYVSSDQVVSPQPQMSPSYTSPGNNYASTSGTSDTSRFSFDQQSSQIYGLSSVDRGQGKSSTGGMTSEYVRQELRAMVGAKTQQQQQTQAQQFQYSLSGGSNPEGSVSTPNHQTFNQAELDALVLSLDLGTGDSSSGLFPPSLLGVSNNQCSISQVPSHSPRDEEPKPADEKKSLLQQLLQHTPEPC